MKLILILITLFTLSCEEKPVSEETRLRAEYMFKTGKSAHITMNSKNVNDYKRGVEERIKLYDKYSKLIKLKPTYKSVDLLRLAILHKHSGNLDKYEQYMDEAFDIYGMERNEKNDRYMALYQARFNTNFKRPMNEFLGGTEEAVEKEWADIQKEKDLKAQREYDEYLESIER